MYFLIEPKSRKEDLFNYNYEFTELKKAIERKEKIIAVLGVRRVGKTSLLNVVYNESKGLKVWLDGRIVSSPKKEILSALHEVAKSGRSRIFGRVESLNISAFGMGFDIKVSLDSLAEMEKKIKSSGRIVVFIDEAQRMDRKELSDVLSYFYDRLSNVSFILSGSEVGLIEDVLGEADGQHPLYGRRVTKIILNRLDRNRAFDFLSEGFKQTEIEIADEELYGAIDELDGLIGWITLFGYEKAIVKNKDALNKTVEIASGIVVSELETFFKKTKSKGLYLAVLRNTAGLGWNELKLKTERGLGRQINPNSFSLAIKKLVDYSFLEKRNDKYYLSDPLILKASFLLT